MKKATTILDWEYCECGCKGYAARFGGKDYWIYWDLKNSYYLHEGHGFVARRLGTFRSMEEADKLAANLHIDEIRESHKKTGALLRRAKKAGL